MNSGRREKIKLLKIIETRFGGMPPDEIFLRFWSNQGLIKQS